MLARSYDKENWTKRHQMTKLSIGMAFVDDFDGVYFTVQSLRLHHSLDGVELIIVDNGQPSQHGLMVKNLAEVMLSGGTSARYIAMPEPRGTSAPRQQVFDEAKGEIVLCLDSHVLLAPGSIEALIGYFESNKDSKDLVSGPMIMDDLKSQATHFEPVWRGEMYGIWATDKRADTQAEPFEIPGHGLGAFAMRKAAWPGFNKSFRGFGGEELYIHEKVRRAGGKNLCLPRFRWLHRFGRPAGVTYPLTRWNKVRNYVLGHRELGWSLDPIHKHFVEDGKFTQTEWDELTSGDEPVENPSNKSVDAMNKACSSCGDSKPVIPGTLAQWYEQALSVPSDINEHVPTLRSLAAQCDHVTEFGVRRGVSTVALLYGQPKRLISYDLKTAPEVSGLSSRQGECVFEFRQGDSRSVEIEETDMLFIDTTHQAEHTAAELKNAAGKVRRWLVFHDTVTFGEVGDNGSPGILHAIRDFVRSNPEWSVIRDDKNNHGLMVLSRNPADKPALPGVFRMGWNFAKALAGRAAGAERLSLDIAEERLKVCDICDKRVGEQCSMCGCYLADGPGGIDGRAFYSNLDCPSGKWPVGGTAK